jgi:adenine-specific DNA-methyltransferase
MKTELVWEGKYDEYGNRRPVKLPTTPLPLQRIEAIDAPCDAAKAMAARQGDLFDVDAFEKGSHRDDFRNMLIWGDNKLAIKGLLDGDPTNGVKPLRGAVDLIYIDPPFDVGADFSLDVTIGEKGDGLSKEPSILEAVAFRDMWGREGQAYPHFMHERLALAKELLAPQGNLVLHCDWRMNYVLRAIIEDLLPGTFRNEIIWYYYNKFQGNVGQFAANHDTLIYYSKSSSFYFRPIREKRDKKTKQLKRVWDKHKGSIVNAKDADGRIIYIETDERTIDDVWRLSMLQPADKTENVGYATQKPESLLERVIESCCPAGGIVVDFFCGSGTTCAVAEKLGRRWVGIDLGRYSVHTARKRMIGTQRELHAKNEPYRSFDVYNLGRYERQWWQFDRLKNADEEHRAIVLKFYKAAPLTNAASPLLHGMKNGAYVHVDQIDTIFVFNEAQAVATAAQAVGAREVHVLAWEFEMELKQKLNALTAETGVKLRTFQIPREIMEPNRNEVQFFEAGALEAEAVKSEEGSFDVVLTHFIPALAEAPEAELQMLKERAIKSPFDFIDFWAIDFDYSPKEPFEHHWQDFRTRKDRSLKTVSDAGWQYGQKGKHRICVKVIDVFGVDTTTVLEVVT